MLTNSNYSQSERNLLDRVIKFVSDLHKQNALKTKISLCLGLCLCLCLSLSLLCYLSLIIFYMHDSHMLYIIFCVRKWLTYNLKAKCQIQNILPLYSHGYTHISELNIV